MQLNRGEAPITYSASRSLLSHKLNLFLCGTHKKKFYDTKKTLRLLGAGLLVVWGMLVFLF